MIVIYKIYFKNNPKTIYIGQTGRKIKKRLYEHIYKAMNSNYSSKLYNWLRKNINAGHNPIIEKVCICDDVNKEAEIISMYVKQGFRLKNTAEGGGGKPIGLLMPEEFCDMQRERMLENGTWQGEENPSYGKYGTENHASICIYQYNVNGLFVQKHDSIRLAAIDLGSEKYLGLISRETKNNKIGYAYGFQWSRNNLESVPIYESNVKKMSEEDIVKANEMYISGISVNKISKFFNVSRTQINAKLKSNN